MNSLWNDLPPHLRENPFFHFSEKNNFVPAWDKIRPEHVMPAMDHVMGLVKRDIEAIATNKAFPTYRNTVEAMEKSFGMSTYFFLTLFNMMPNSEEERKQYDEIQKTLSNRYSDLFSDIFLDPGLFIRFKLIGMNAGLKKMPQEKAKLLGMYYNTFIVSGIQLKPEKQKQLREVGQKIAEVGLRSQTNMRKAEEASFIVVSDRSKLAGLPDMFITKAAADAEKRGFGGQWAFGIGNETYGPFIKSVKDRGLREQMWRTYTNAAVSGPHDNRATILELINLEHQQARLKGYRSPASESLRYNLAQNTKTVEKFLMELRQIAKPVAEREMEVIRKFALQADGISEIKPWDVEYYEERIKERVLGFDDEALRPYFELENVLQGSFRHLERLFGLRFEESNDYPKYSDDLRIYNVKSARSGKHMGVLCLDLFAKEGKYPGTAWNISVLPQGLFEGKVRRPVDMIVTKFVKSANGDPTLLTHYDVEVLFHELGHASHNLVSKCRYQSFSGTSVDRDFVEFPSQIQENWAFEPAVLDDFARHYRTGEKLPDDIKEKLAQSRKFMAGKRTLNSALKGWLDLSWYRKDPAKITDVESFENATLRKFRLIPSEGSVISARFSHSFGGGYEAAYYSYQWSEVMSDQLFDKFKKNGLYDRSLRAKFRHALEEGGRSEEAALYRKAAGRAPDNRAFYKAKGLLGKQFSYAAAFVPEPANENRPQQPPYAYPFPRSGPDKGFG